MSQILNDNLYISNQEISREELIHTFEILYNKGLINKSELQRAITITNNKYKPMRQIMSESITESDIK